MPTVSVRISEDMKNEMEKHPTVNWSEVLRQAIKNQLKNQHRSSQIKAVLINERIRKVAPKGWDSTEIIRKDRR
ncbi:MAG: hypothetical protein GPJ54_11810, partial [Candidatus Heimdallarchaeota archaeon]|nr:hypothetical protein [Candidatus Heimdallarchaeota archaeon]